MAELKLNISLARGKQQGLGLTNPAQVGGGVSSVLPFYYNGLFYLLGSSGFRTYNPVTKTSGAQPFSGQSYGNSIVIEDTIFFVSTAGEVSVYSLSGRFSRLTIATGASNFNYGNLFVYKQTDIDNHYWIYLLNAFGQNTQRLIDYYPQYSSTLPNFAIYEQTPNFDYPCGATVKRIHTDLTERTFICAANNAVVAEFGYDGINYGFYYHTYPLNNYWKSVGEWGDELYFGRETGTGYSTFNKVTKQWTSYENSNFGNVFVKMKDGFYTANSAGLYYLNPITKQEEFLGSFPTAQAQPNYGCANDDGTIAFFTSGNAVSSYFCVYDLQEDAIFLIGKNNQIIDIIDLS